MLDPIQPAALDCDVLVAGAGPTGLALAAQLHRFGTRYRIIDRQLERVHESRALGVQARSLEILQTLGLGEALVARGRRGSRVRLHFGGRARPEFVIGDIGVTDTRFPFLLFVSQEETEGVLGEWLTSAGGRIERGVELARFETAGNGVECTLRHGDREERVRTRYLVGCDGARSVVRRALDLDFEGDRYPQDFVLGDVRIEGDVVPDALNLFARGNGLAVCFPMTHPAPWRVIAMDTVTAPDVDAPPGGDALSLAELQTIVDQATGGSIRLYDAAWLSRFRLHHRQAKRYRVGNVFLAGDAAHIHSPVGAQGMNTGIQDAWNLGWKLAFVARGCAPETLLDSYDRERWKVGRRLLHFTDRAFEIVTRFAMAGPRAAMMRRVFVGPMLQLAMSRRWLRRRAFRFISQLGIRYRRSPAVQEGRIVPKKGPHAGDRMPDGVLRDGSRATRLHEVLSAPSFHLVICGDAPDDIGFELVTMAAAPLAVHRVAERAMPGALVDESGALLELLSDGRPAHYLVRPDGHVAFRSAGTEYGELKTYIQTWLRGNG